MPGSKRGDQLILTSGTGFPLYLASAGAEDAGLWRELERIRRRIGEERAGTSPAAGSAPPRRPRSLWVLLAVIGLAAAAVGVTLALVGSGSSAPPAIGTALEQKGASPDTPVGVAGEVPADQLAGHPLVMLAAGTSPSLLRGLHWIVLGPGASGAAVDYVLAHGSQVEEWPNGARLYRLAAPPPTSTPPTTIPPPTTVPVAPPAPPAPTPSRVTVVAGDNFWTIAAHTVTLRLHQTATPAQIVPFWQALIAANQGRLVHPGNPNLIYPGQVLVLPPA